jgi:hypothetical protein
MSHSFYSADQATHCRVIGFAFVTVVLVILLSISLFSKSDQQAVSGSIVRAGVPVTTTDGGYLIIR